MTDFIQTVIMAKKYIEMTQKEVDEKMVAKLIKYIGSGGALPQGSEDFKRFWTDTTFTEK